MGEAQLLWELDMVLDLDGDRRDEVLIYDRRKILVYGAPFKELEEEFSWRIEALRVLR